MLKELHPHYRIPVAQLMAAMIQIEVQNTHISFVAKEYFSQGIIGCYVIFS